MGSVNLIDQTSSSKARSLKKKIKIATKCKNGGHASFSQGKSSSSDIRKPNFKKSRKASQPKDVKGKCFYCYEMGHWKRNCPKFLAEKKGEGNVPFPNLHVLELNYVDDSLNS